MIRTLLVLALAGWVLSAGPPSPTPLLVGQEHWKFVGKIMTGVSNPRQTFAGTVLDIDILIDRQADKSIEVTFSKVTSQDFNEQVYIGEPSEAIVGGGPGRSPKAGGYVGDRKDVKELEGTFKAFLDREHGTVMEVPADEQIWVTNVRKAIMNMLKVPPYTGDRHFVDLERNAFTKEHNSRAAEERISFKKREHIFAGICNVSYTMTRDANDGHWKGSPDNVIPGDGEFFRMRRSVDFDSCLDVVNFQKTSVGNFTHSYKGQMKEVSERSTYGEYLMKKNTDGSFQLKGILQTGDTIVRPFGQDTGRVIVHSNQTMSLQSLSRSGASRPRVQAAQQSEGRKPVNTWLYQFTSPASPDPSTEVDWVIYEKKHMDQPLYPEYAVLGGSYFQQEDILNRAKSDLETITKLQQEQVADYKRPYSGTTDGRLSNLLKVLAHSIRALNRENVKKLFEETDKDSTRSDRIKRQSFLDAVAASGSAQGIQELILAAEAKKIPLIRMGGLMALLTNNIIDPSALKELLNYVMSPKEESKYLEVMSHLNFAKLTRRVCFDEQKKNYTVPQAYLGNRRCDRDAIETVFVNHLKSKIQSSPEIWRKLMYTHALGLLGLEDTIPYLCNLATGQDPNSSPTLRMGAIYSLTHHFNRGEKREKVIRQLLPIAESHTEDFEIREIAFIAVMYMRPNATLLQRFVFNGWRDPSSQMKSIIASTLISLAQSSDPDYRDMTTMARQLLPMLEMTQPSLQNSIFFDYKERIPDFKIGFESKFIWASTHPSKLLAPRQMLADLKADFGGVVVPIIKVYTMLDLDMSKSSLQSPRNAHNEHQRKIHQELAELSADLELEQREGTDEVYMYASTFNYEFFFAPSKQLISAAKQRVISYLDKAAGKPSSPFHPEEMVKFFNLVDVLSILPTPFGTPSIVEVSAPNNWLSDYEYIVKKESGNEFNITINGLSKMIMKTQSLMKVMMPWHNKTAVAGIDTEHSVNLPGKLSMLIGEIFPYPLLKTTISPVYRGELPLVYSRSKPLSALQPIDPTADLSSSDHIISPAADPNARYKRSFDVPMALLGLKSRVTYEGDVEYPYVQSHLMKFVLNPERLVTLLTSQTQKEYALSYRLNIDESETKNITLAALLVIKEKHLPSHVPLDGTSEEVGQKIAQRLSIKDSLEEQLVKARNGEFGDFTISLAVNYTTPNVRTRQYQLALTGTNITKPNPTGYEQNMILNIMSMGRPEDPQQKKICLVTSLSEKLTPEMDQKDSELYTLAATDIYAGKDCSVNEKVGETGLRMYLTNSYTSEQPPMRSLRSSGLFIGEEGRPPWIVDAFYNRMDMHFKWLKEVSPYYQNLTNRVQDLAYGYLFPHVNRNRLLSAKGPERTVIVNVTRNSASATIDAWVQSPEEIAVIEQVNVAPLFDWASPLLGPHERFYNNIGNDRQGRRALQAASGSRCFVTAQQVVTFDGVSFKKTPTTCWRVVTQVQHQQDTFAVMSRQDKSSAQSEKEVQILIPGVGKIEIIRGEQVKVDGQVVTGSKTIKDTTGKVVGSVNASPDRILVSVPSKLEVVLQDKTDLTITLAEKYRSFMNGLCGDFNGEQAADMRSPKGCIYNPSQGPVFAASWVTKKNSCEDPAMKELLEEARRNEQENCHKSLSSNSKQGQQQQRHSRQQGRHQ